MQLGRSVEAVESKQSAVAFTAETSGMAIVSLVLGLFFLMLPVAILVVNLKSSSLVGIMQEIALAAYRLLLSFYIWLPGAIGAVILGHISCEQIRRSHGRLRGTSIANAGLMLGFFDILFVPLIFFICAIAIPNLLRLSR